MKNNGRIVCPVCGADLGPQQVFASTLTGCRRCHVWVNNAGEVVKNTYEHFKAWQQRKEQLKHEREQHRKYIKAQADGRASEGRVEERVIAKENLKPN